MGVALGILGLVGGYLFVASAGSVYLVVCTFHVGVFNNRSTFCFVGDL